MDWMNFTRWLSASRRIRVFKLTMKGGICRIDVNVMPPMVGDTVLIRLESTDGDAVTDAAYLDNQLEFVTFNGWPMNVWTITHWMPMPYVDLEGSATT